MGYTTYVELSANEALAKIEKLKIDALITDVMMPEMNGYQLAQLVRRNLPKLPIIFISGYSGKDIESRYAEVQEHSIKLSKPVRQSVIAKALREILSGTNHVYIMLNERLVCFAMMINFRAGELISKGTNVFLREIHPAKIIDLMNNEMVAKYLPLLSGDSIPKLPQDTVSELSQRFQYKAHGCRNVD